MNAIKRLLKQAVPQPSVGFEDKLKQISTQPQALDAQFISRQSHMLLFRVPAVYAVFASVTAVVLMLFVFTAVLYNTAVFDYSLYAMHEFYLDDLYTDYSSVLLGISS